MAQEALVKSWDCYAHYPFVRGHGDRLFKSKDKPEIIDGDGDGRIYDGTEHERDADPSRLRKRRRKRPKDGEKGPIKNKENPRQDIQTLVDKINTEFGFTYDPVDELSPTKGFSVAKYPERELAIPIEEVTAEKLLDYFLDNEDIYMSDDLVHVGAWYNKKTDDNPDGDDLVYFDLPVIVDDLKQAEKMARELGQLKIYDLAAGQEIETMTPQQRKEWENEQKNKSKSHCGQAGEDSHAVEKSSARDVSRDPWRRSNKRGLGKSRGKASRGQRQEKEKKLASQEKHLGPGLHPNGTPQSIHGKSRAAGNLGALVESLDSWLLAYGFDPSETWTRSRGYQKLPVDSVVQDIATEQEVSVGPPDEVTVASYEVFKNHLLSQYQAVLDSGLKVYAWEGEGEPYKSSPEKLWSPSSTVMREAVDRDGEFYFFMTENGFGAEGATESTDHPLLAMSPAETSDGRPMLYNDVFRVVHDSVAHLRGGFSFSTRGEMNAMVAHASTLPSEAWPALWAETFGQNAVYETTGQFADQNVYSTRYIDMLQQMVSEASVNQPIERSIAGGEVDTDMPVGFGRIKRRPKRFWNAGIGEFQRKSLPEIIDGDGDGRIYDGTEHERDADPSKRFSVTKGNVAHSNISGRELYDMLKDTENYSIARIVSTSGLNSGTMIDDRAIEDWFGGFYDDWWVMAGSIGDGSPMSFPKFVIKARSFLRSENKAARMAEALDRVGGSSVIMFSNADADMSMIVHPSTYPGVAYQLTTMGRGRDGTLMPYGHSEHETRESAIASAIGAHSNHLRNDGNYQYVIAWADEDAASAPIMKSFASSVMRAKDGDGDGFVFDGTPRERAADPKEEKKNSPWSDWKDAGAIKRVKWSFPTSSKMESRFEVAGVPFTAYARKIKGVKDGLQFGFVDDESGDAITGKGQAYKVMKQAVIHTASAIGEMKPSVMQFSSRLDQPSRIELYRFMASRANRLFPKYIGCEITSDKKKMQSQHFALVREDYLDQYQKEELAFGHNVKPVRGKLGKSLGSLDLGDEFWDELLDDLVGSSRKSLPEIIDGDGDGRIYDGTEHERDADPSKLEKKERKKKPSGEPRRKIPSASNIGQWALTSRRNSTRDEYEQNRANLFREMSNPELAFAYLHSSQNPVLHEDGETTGHHDEGLRRIELELRSRGVSYNEATLMSHIRDLDLTGNTDSGERLAEASRKPITISELVGQTSVDEHLEKVSIVEQKKTAWENVVEQTSRRSDAAHEAYREYRQALDDVSNSTMHHNAMNAAKRLVESEFGPVDLEGSVYEQHEQRMIRAQKARDIYKAIELARDQEENSTFSYSLLRARGAVEDFAIREERAASMLLNPVQEQARFEFDTGARGDSERDEGLREFYRGRKENLELEISSIKEQIDSLTTSDPGSSKLSLLASQLNEKQQAKKAYSDKFVSVSDLTTKKLSSKEQERIEELMEPTYSEALVRVEGGNVDYFDDLDYDQQDRIRDQFRMAMDNDRREYSDYRDAIRHQVETYQMNDAYRDVADEIDVDASLISNYDWYFENEIRERREEIAYDEDISESDVDDDQVFESLAGDRDIQRMVDVSFVKNNASDFEYEIDQKVNERVDNDFEEAWPEYIEERLDDTDLLDWAKYEGIEVRGEGGLDDTPFSDQDIASMVGAPDDATVTVTVEDSDNIDIQVSHGDWDNFHRILERQYDGNWVMKHEHLSKSEDVKRRSMAAELFRVAIPSMIENGVDRIETYAAGNPQTAKNGGYNGYRTWPRYGFDYSIDRLGRFGNEVREEFPDAETILDVMETKKGRKWWKENGTSMSGMVFDLSEGSRSVETLGRYLLHLDKLGKDFGV